MATKSKLALLGGNPVATDLSPVAWPPVSEKTAERLKEVYLSKQWSFDREPERKFAKAYAKFHDAAHGVFMVNGTVTLESALAACGVGPGDEVIVPALTWMATAMAVHYVGATPVFADVERSTLCLDPKKAEEAVTAKTKAIIPVHIYGSMANLDAILKLAKKRGLMVIEDCAHMQGGKWNGKGVGSWGTAGSFSFQQSKTLSSGEGGICLSNDDEIARRMFHYKHIGYGPGDEQGKSRGGPPEGLMCHNYRGNSFQAVILSDQLKKLGRLLEKYEKNAEFMRSAVEEIPGVRVQARGAKATRQGYYAFCLIFDEEPMRDVPREAIVAAARAEGLPLGGTYGPVYRHVLYNMPPSSYRLPKEGCPVGDVIAVDRTTSLSHPWLGARAKVIKRIPEIIAKLVENADALRSCNSKT